MYILVVYHCHLLHMIASASVWIRLIWYWQAHNQVTQALRHLHQHHYRRRMHNLATSSRNVSLCAYIGQLPRLGSKKSEKPLGGGGLTNFEKCFCWDKFGIWDILEIVNLKINGKVLKLTSNPWYRKTTICPRSACECKPGLPGASFEHF